MAPELATDSNRSGPTGAARFVWVRFALWLPACLILGWLVSGAAAGVAHFYGEPFLLFPLLVGVVLGAMIVALLRLGQVGNRPTVLLGTVLAVAVAVVGQHWFGYLAQREKYDQDVDKLEIPDEVRGHIPRPPTNLLEFLQDDAVRGRLLPGGYVARGRMAWLSWSVDGLLVMAATLAMVAGALRQPYCNRCRSWYRVIRSGRIEAATARRLAEIAEMAPDDESIAARYRLLSCNAGCGPSGFELSWDKSPGPASLRRCWPDVDRRNRIGEVLDEMETAENGS